MQAKTFKFNKFYIRALWLLFVFSMLSLSSCSRKPKLPQTRLVILIVVDQLWPPYLERYEQYFSGGLKTLLNSSANFSKASHDFAGTETCPGHASLVSGTYPSKSGIIANHWYDRAEGKLRYCVQDEYYGLSPKSMKVTSIADWIKGTYPGGKAYAVSGKDRSAILLAGRKAEAAFWYSTARGTFKTSKYYDLLEDSWLFKKSAERQANRYFGLMWGPLNKTKNAYQSVNKSPLQRGVLEPRFPYPFGSASLGPDRDFYKSVYKSPFVDSLTWEFARQILIQEQLGTQPESVDYLGISFSALDTVGHMFGPESPEALDVLLRLDAILGDLINTVQERVGMDKALIVLSSDHGVQPYPEAQVGVQHKKSRRIGASDISCVQKAGKKISDQLGVKNIWKDELVVDWDLMRSERIPRKKVDLIVSEALEECPMIEKLWTRDELLFNGDVENKWQELYKRSITKDRGNDYYIQSPEGLLLYWPSGTGHGTPYWYDRHVPLLFAGSKIKGKKINKPVSTIDVAPTIASLLDIPVPDFVQGQDMADLIFSDSEE